MVASVPEFTMTYFGHAGDHVDDSSRPVSISPSVGAPKAEGPLLACWNYRIDGRVGGCGPESSAPRTARSRRSDCRPRRTGKGPVASGEENGVAAHAFEGAYR